MCPRPGAHTWAEVREVASCPMLSFLSDLLVKRFERPNRDASASGGEGLPTRLRCRRVSLKHPGRKQANASLVRKIGGLCTDQASD